MDLIIIIVFLIISLIILQIVYDINFKKIKENLGSKIEGRMDKEGNFSYKKAVESSKMGWKGKAAIFGGVALGALALVGVASMVMSGGRQQNSNLYNPYQAMY